MREIKFRVWDSQKKLMYGCMEISWLPNGKMSFRKGSGIQMDESLGDVLMQYTGLKDKNGVDLNWWEDDLLSKGSGHPNAPVGKISYNENYACWEIVGNSGTAFCTLEAAYENGWKKIGNIYQHPELLEKK